MIAGLSVRAHVAARVERFRESEGGSYFTTKGDAVRQHGIAGRCLGVKGEGGVEGERLARYSYEKHLQRIHVAKGGRVRDR